MKNSDIAFIILLIILISGSMFVLMESYIYVKLTEKYIAPYHLRQKMKNQVYAEAVYTIHKKFMDDNSVSMFRIDNIPFKTEKIKKVVIVH